MKILLLLHFILIGNLIGRDSADDTLALYHGSRKVKKIALTFDACPSSVHGGYDTNVVKTLADSGVAATFFLSGKWIKRHRREVRYFSKNKNFELGNHSFTHPHCTVMREDSVITELIKTDSLLKSIAGRAARLFRPPYAETDNKLEMLTDSLGYRTVMYDVASGDPDTTFSKERLIKSVVSRVRNGSIVVMHINGRGWHTAAALPEIISQLRQKGFRFVKVSELPETNALRGSSQRRIK